ncbi:MAG TPA: GNAT family N-acetyltransferase [Hyphomicrobium sp.]|nr:GNAT family N-acetyltransferase [Hyphomicrobium sp.]
MIANFESWASERGGWTLDRATSAAEVEAASSTLISLQNERLSPRFLAFQREYLASQTPSEQIELATLRVAGAPVACMYTIRNGTSVLAYHYGGAAVPGLDIGVTMSALMIMRAIARGDSAFDFLGGGFGYEAEFATDERAVCSLRAVRPTWRETVRLSLIDARDAARAAVQTGQSLARKYPFGSMWNPAQR